MKTLIAIPALNMVHTDFATSLLRLERVPESQTAITNSSLTYDGRNNLGLAALENGFDRILWLDSDMTFEPDFMERMTKTMDDFELEYLSALYFKRTLPTKPVIFETLEYIKKPDEVTIKVENFKTYPKDKLFPIAGSGFGGCITSTKLIEKVYKNFGLPFSPIMGMGEDISFCWRVGQLGISMWCDSSIKMGHIATLPITEAQYDVQMEKRS